MKFFIDECISPQLAMRLNETGVHDAVHPLHIGRRGEPDHQVLTRCIGEDRVIVTQNARDFRKLVGKTPLHPGLIIVPQMNREETWVLLQKAVAFLAARGNPADVIVNHVLELEESAAATLTPLPR
jgi:predicted nuclease of predicted toxin-antitoxin system